MNNKEFLDKLRGLILIAKNYPTEQKRIKIDGYCIIPNNEYINTMGEYYSDEDVADWFINIEDLLEPDDTRYKCICINCKKQFESPVPVIGYKCYQCYQGLIPSTEPEPPKAA